MIRAGGDPGGLPQASYNPPQRFRFADLAKVTLGRELVFILYLIIS